MLQCKRGGSPAHTGNLCHAQRSLAQRCLPRTEISAGHRDLCRAKRWSFGVKIWAFGTKIDGNWWKRLGETGANNDRQQQQPKTTKNYAYFLLFLVSWSYTVYLFINWSSGSLIGMLDPAGASTLGASTRWDQRVSAPAVGTDDADDDDDFQLLFLIL